MEEEKERRIKEPREEETKRATGNGEGEFGRRKNGTRDKKTKRGRGKERELKRST